MMFRMKIDSSPESNTLSHHELILQRLARLGVPEENLSEGPRGLVAYVKNDKCQIAEFVSAILPSDEEETEAVSETRVGSAKEAAEDIFSESMIWLQWLMFDGDPILALEHLAKMNANQRGVCGAVWGIDDLAYRCRTCEHDSTCAICVPCFENGNHKDHDYSIIYTGGGCCDCGDITAWKREGFCSKHKGAEKMQPLPEDFAKSLRPVLDSFLIYWREKLLCSEIAFQGGPRPVNHVAELPKSANDLTSAVVEMLLEFCKNSESLLSFISERIYSCPGLLDVLLRAERFLSDGVVGKLHELLLKLIGEPIFKYEFAKVFLSYYPTVVNEAVKENSDAVFKKYQLLSTFSVQILTVPTLTPHLVEEKNLLAMLFECLERIFVSCAGEDGRLQVAKWSNLYETTVRVVEHIRFVMSHSVVSKYLCHGGRDFVRTWMRLLGSVQGMNPHKRETGSHIEEENENIHLPFVLCHSISNILYLLVAGAFSMNSSEETNEDAFFSACKPEFEDQDRLRHAKVGRLSQDSSVGSVIGKNAFDHASKAADNIPIPSSALWLTFECLRAIENWLVTDNTVGPLSILSPKSSNGSGNNFLALKRTLSKFRRGRPIFKSFTSSDSKLTVSSEVFSKRCSSPSHGGFNVGVGLDCGRPIGQEADPGGCDDSTLDGGSSAEFEGLRFLNFSDWPDVMYDVSSQGISVHIPLHQLLSMILRRALKQCYGESASLDMMSARATDRSSAIYNDFLGHMLGGCHPYGFSAFVMEHPLRIRVFSAEVHAGMWRRNGDAPILSSEWYRSVRWSEQGQELDLFLLQCCAALAPADLYVKRILERFGLSNYLSLNLNPSSEHESTLVAEMLTLLIQIVSERRFCGLTTVECLQRELVYKLSIGDATRSQLVKSLPRDLSKIGKLEEILETIAEYSRPSGMSQGMYKLRSAYWKDLDLYHPRWNSRDLQAAEERYFRFCNVSALTTQLPKWTKIYYPLRGISQIATCKTLLQIVRAILFYAVFTDELTPSRAPDRVLLNALHLLALALDVCQVQKEYGDLLCYSNDVIPFLAFANEEICMNKFGDQSMLSLLVLLMRMHEKENAENFTEPGNFRLSSLILNLLKKFAELEPGCMTSLHKLEPELAYQLSVSIHRGNTNDMASSSDSEKRKTKARERQAAILEKMRAQQSKFLASINSSSDDEMDGSRSVQLSCDSDVSNPQESAQVVCSLCHDPNSRSPISFLVLLQKSRVLSFVDKGPPSWEYVSHTGKEHISKSTATTDLFQRSCTSGDPKMFSSSQLMDVVENTLNDFALMGQTSEMNAFLEFIRVLFPSIENVQLPCISEDMKEKTAYSLEPLEEHMYLMIRGFRASLWDKDSHRPVGNFSTTGVNLEKSRDAESLLLGKYIAALSREALDNPSASEQGRSLSDRTQSESNMLHPECNGFGPSGSGGIYVSSCGHAVHQGCLDRYLSSLRDRYIRRIVFEGGHIVDPEQGEFLCPVCRGLANSVLPASPGDFRKFHPLPIPTVNSMNTASSSSLSDSKVSSLSLEDGLCLLKCAADVAISNELLKAFPVGKNVTTPPNLEPLFRVLSGMCFPGVDKGSGRVNHSVILWDTLKYSLMSAEIAARSRKNSLTPNLSLGSLYKELNSSCGFILSLLLNVIQSIRAQNSQNVLLRLRGIQLFAKSVCSGTSSNEISNHNHPQEGHLLCILENAEAEVRYPDVQLWRRASDPVLAHDAFSTLMWILFCLPCPFLSCKDSYLYLVHVCYVVTVTQAIIIYCSKRLCTISELGFHDCLITDIFKFMEEHGEALQSFDSNYINPTYDMKDAIRSLSFPYLRRCALLWKLINHSTKVPFTDGACTFDGSPYADDDSECVTNIVEELSEVEKLEKMFNIPPLGIVINDKKSRITAFRWLCHFSEVCGVRNSQYVLKCNPAVPFKLMLLPHLYQDLLQRYIKKRCPDCGDVQEEPALCLLCGKLCSANWKNCCSCQTHAKSCGAGIGVFLLIRRTTILLQRSARQSPWPSPYLDAFGEEDVEMRRGKPLYLNEERYAALTHMVASHGLDRSSKVLRQTTTGAFFMF
ncbi:E3 ubiquitin- ligase PRT6-like isoform X1 [Olea europaea subsp. europaea]|uniref:E3 ubiquitin-protein ligase n=1 Tax=Olea europaea subsp. europaea TaxID=158383 RepID=A0A8S0QAG9_OLEEU|nr:E3 ubiquitin- ligase PRT6-like isoform X1 [Olea europaea subsp. europaea]